MVLLFVWTFGRTLYVGRCLYEAFAGAERETYPMRRMAAILRGLLSGLILVMRGKAGPSRLSSDQQTLPLQLQPKAFPE
jgi:hypothetical protein